MYMLQTRAPVRPCILPPSPMRLMLLGCCSMPEQSLAGGIAAVPLRRTWQQKSKRLTCSTCSERLDHHDPTAALVSSATFLSVWVKLGHKGADPFVIPLPHISFFAFFLYCNSQLRLPCHCGKKLLRRIVALKYNIQAMHYRPWLLIVLGHQS
jgi:hypothetical protein